MLDKLKRLFKHRWLDEKDTRRAIPPDMVERLARRVAASERRHSGEVRICVESGLPPSYIWRGAKARERAVTLFGKLRVWDTEDNNGVLIYLLLADRDVEIIADRGIDRRVGQAEWQAICARMEAAFSQSRYAEGVVGGVTEISALLARHYPRTEAAENELPDRPVVL